MEFNEIPSNIRVPLAYIEFDNSRANAGTPNVMHKILVMAQMLATGSAEAEKAVRVLEGQGDALFGRGSMAAAMAEILKTNNRYTECWFIPVNDDGAAVAAAGTITFGGAPTKAGTVNLMIGGQRVRVPVASGDALADIATAAAALMGPTTSLLATGVVNATPEQVDVTARNKGECGNDIDIRVNYYQGEELPEGLTVTIVGMAGGTANPDLANAIAALGDEWYNYIVMPYTDAANLTALEADLSDRWGPTRMVDGQAYSAYRGTHSATGTFGEGRNSVHVTYMPTGLSPEPPCLWAAAYAAQAAASLSIDPARPLQTLYMIGLKPPAIDQRWTLEERNLLLYDGVASFKVDAGERVLIERAITNYQENAYGVADPSYLNVNTPATLSYLRFSLRARITQKYPRHKLADDGTKFAAGQPIVTPKTILAEAIALFKEWELDGLVENVDQYKQDIIVERDADDRDRLNVLCPPDIINQFRIFAAQVQFRL